jgi:hypothetical protein
MSEPKDKIELYELDPIERAILQAIEIKLPDMPLSEALRYVLDLMQRDRPN